MPDIIRDEMFTADTIMDLLSETTDDYLFLWDIQMGSFYISEKAFDDLDIDRSIETDVVSAWSKIMIPEDLPRWLEDMDRIQKGKGDFHDMEYRLFNKAGRVIWVSCRGRVKKDSENRPVFMIGRISNIGKQNKFDNVTGLRNRSQFEKDLKQLLDREQAVRGLVAVLDIDNFRNVNEKYSYVFGDRVLNVISTLISSLLPEGCTLYRLDGDEFVFFLQGGKEEDVRGIYENIQMFTGNHFIVDEQPLPISVSAGICFFPKDGTTYQALFRNAENAVEIAKMNGKNQLALFSENLYKRKLRNMELQESLHSCVKNGCRELEVYYQPQVDADTGKLMGAEALLRWHSPEHGEISPVEFIPLLEENRSVIQVGKWVLEESIKKCSEWRKKIPGFTMSVNVSYIQMKENDLLEYLKAKSEEGIGTEHFILELTESCWVPNLHFLNQKLKGLQDMGYGIAIDDFGTGYSSLSYLKNLPANLVKIDRSFIKGIKKGSYEYIFLEYTIRLAHSICSRVCVEGVETAEELEVVRQASPDYIQGYLFGRPVSASEFERLYLRRN